MNNTKRTRLERNREYLKPEEVTKLLAASKQPGVSRNPRRDYCMLLLLFRHALRVTELCQMKLSDVDIERKEIHVKRLKSCLSGIHPLYNGESQAIKLWLIERARMQPDCDTLFVSERRQPLGRCALWLMIRKCATAAGLEELHVHPHMLRHSTGYELVNRNTDIRKIQPYLGHRSIQSTVRYTELDSSRFAKMF